MNLPAWERFREEAMKKLDRYEQSVFRLITRTRTPIDPLEIEYLRGLRQGVHLALDGLPNEIKNEFSKLTKE